MFDAAGGALYVGKARDLKKRVASYFQKSGHEPRIAAMIAQVARVETTVVRSEGEALLLENNLIKALEPRYNILFRDDKSYPYICLSGDPYPQLRFHRGALDRKHRYFGPFPSAGAVREGIALLQKVFQLRTCENTVFANRSRPCMLHQIQRCTAPCVGLICRGRLSRGRRRRALLFLQGKTDEVLAQLKRQMDAAAAALRVRARGAHARQDRAAAAAAVAAVRRERDGRRHRRRSPRCTRSNLFAVNVVMIRGGRHVGDRTFFPRHAEAVDEADVVTAFLAQHYVERPVPPTIIAPQADGGRRARRSADGAVGTQGRDRHQSRRRAARVADDGDAECDARDRAEARAEGDAGRAARRAAGGARPAAVGAAHRVLRRVAHDGRGGGRVVRDLRQASRCRSPNTGAST